MPNDYNRQTAVRALASELNSAVFTFKESDADRAPTFNLLPTGERANRVFIVGTLLETEDVGSDSEFWQAEIIDPVGDSYYAYAGQYQPEAAAKIRSLEPPTYVAMVAKVDVYETDDNGLNVSLTPETVTEVEQETRDKWVRETVAQTLDRVASFRSEESSAYERMAVEHYGESVGEIVDAAVESLANIEGSDVESEDLAAEAQSHGEPASAD